MDLIRIAQRCTCISSCIEPGEFMPKFFQYTVEGQVKIPP